MNVIGRSGCAAAHFCDEREGRPGKWLYFFYEEGYNNDRRTLN